MAARQPPQFERGALASVILGDQIYAGANGRIFKATADGKPVAVKVVGAHSSKVECRAYAALKGHRNIVAFKGHRTSHAHDFMVMELCERDLRGAIPPTGFDEGTCMHYYAQVLRAVLYCHKHNVYHGDIKPDNFLLKHESVSGGAVAAFGAGSGGVPQAEAEGAGAGAGPGESGTSLGQASATSAGRKVVDVVKLCDFGSASFLRESRSDSGTDPYLSPEKFAYSARKYDSTPKPGSDRLLATLYPKAADLAAARGLNPMLADVEDGCDTPNAGVQENGGLGGASAGGGDAAGDSGSVGKGSLKSKGSKGSGGSGGKAARRKARSAAPVMSGSVINLHGETYDAAAADVWSLGIVLYVMLKGKEPWNVPWVTDRQFVRYLQRDYSLFDGLSDKATALLKRMLWIDPRDRIKLTDVLRSEYVTNFPAIQEAMARNQKRLQEEERRRRLASMGVSNRPGVAPLGAQCARCSAGTAGAGDCGAARPGNRWEKIPSRTGLTPGGVGNGSGSGRLGLPGSPMHTTPSPMSGGGTPSPLPAVLPPGKFVTRGQRSASVMANLGTYVPQSSTLNRLAVTSAAGPGMSLPVPPAPFRSASLAVLPRSSSSGSGSGTSAEVGSVLAGAASSSANGGVAEEVQRADTSAPPSGGAVVAAETGVDVVGPAPMSPPTSAYRPSGLGIRTDSSQTDPGGSKTAPRGAQKPGDPASGGNVKLSQPFAAVRVRGRAKSVDEVETRKFVEEKLRSEAHNHSNSTRGGAGGEPSSRGSSSAHPGPSTVAQSTPHSDAPGSSPMTSNGTPSSLFNTPLSAPSAATGGTTKVLLPDLSASAQTSPLTQPSFTTAASFETAVPAPGSPGSSGVAQLRGYPGPLPGRLAPRDEQGLPAASPAPGTGTCSVPSDAGSGRPPPLRGMRLVAPVDDVERQEGEQLEMQLRMASRSTTAADRGGSTNRTGASTAMSSGPSGPQSAAFERKPSGLRTVAMGPPVLPPGLPLGPGHAAVQVQGQVQGHGLTIGVPRSASPFTGLAISQAAAVSSASPSRVHTMPVMPADATATLPVPTPPPAAVPGVPLAPLVPAVPAVAAMSAPHSAAVPATVTSAVSAAGMQPSLAAAVSAVPAGTTQTGALAAGGITPEAAARFMADVAAAEGFAPFQPTTFATPPKPRRRSSVGAEAEITGGAGGGGARGVTFALPTSRGASGASSVASAGDGNADMVPDDHGSFAPGHAPLGAQVFGGYEGVLDAIEPGYELSMEIRSVRPSRDRERDRAARRHHRADREYERSGGAIIRDGTMVHDIPPSMMLVPPSHAPGVAEAQTGDGMAGSGGIGRAGAEPVVYATRRGPMVAQAVRGGRRRSADKGVPEHLHRKTSAARMVMVDAVGASHGDATALTVEQQMAQAQAVSNADTLVDAAGGVDSTLNIVTAGGGSVAGHVHEVQGLWHTGLGAQEGADALAVGDEGDLWDGESDGSVSGWSEDDDRYMADHGIDQFVRDGVGRVRARKAGAGAGNGADVAPANGEEEYDDDSDGTETGSDVSDAAGWTYDNLEGASVMSESGSSEESRRHRRHSRFDDAFSDGDMSLEADDCGWNVEEEEEDTGAPDSEGSPAWDRPVVGLVGGAGVGVGISHGPTDGLGAGAHRRGTSAGSARGGRGRGGALGILGSQSFAGGTLFSVLHGEADRTAGVPGLSSGSGTRSPSSATSRAHSPGSAEGGLLSGGAGGTFTGLWNSGSPSQPVQQQTPSRGGAWSSGTGAPGAGAGVKFADVVAGRTAGAGAGGRLFERAGLLDDEEDEDGTAVLSLSAPLSSARVIGGGSVGFGPLGAQEGYEGAFGPALALASPLRSPAHSTPTPPRQAARVYEKAGLDADISIGFPDHSRGRSLSDQAGKGGHGQVQGQGHMRGASQGAAGSPSGAASVTPRRSGVVNVHALRRGRSSGGLTDPLVSGAAGVGGVGGGVTPGKSTPSPGPGSRPASRTPPQGTQGSAV